MSQLLSVSVEDRVDGRHVRVTAHEGFTMVRVGGAEPSIAHLVGDTLVGSIPAEFSVMIEQMIDKARRARALLMEGTP